MAKLPEYRESLIKHGSMTAFMYGTSSTKNGKFVGSKKKNKRMKRGK